MIVDKKKEQARQDYLRHKDAYLARAKKWAENNPEKRKEIVGRYNKKASLKKRLWHENKQFGITVMREKCMDCGEHLSSDRRNLVVHHIDGNNGKRGKPLNNDMDNLVVLCRKCHPTYHYGGAIRKEFVW